MTTDTKNSLSTAGAIILILILVASLFAIRHREMGTERKLAAIPNQQEYWAQAEDAGYRQALWDTYYCASRYIFVPDEKGNVKFFKTDCVFADARPNDSKRK